MQVVHARCCGLDVHRKTVVACVLLTEEAGRVRRLTRCVGYFGHPQGAQSGCVVSLVCGGR